ncbi:MAG TPA: PEGA domain-containing protein [Candidatus Limnocylindria bacterium]|nr:PEGA domain-containing protein [Candidatus Limnocylindria bacterium]
MRVACSLILSSSLLFPSAALPLTQTTQDKNAKQAAQEPQSVAPVVKQPLAFGLEDSTPVKLRINRNISSADAQVNETVDFEVLEEVKVHDVVVIPRGGMAWATVTEAQPKRRMGRAGKLNINIDNVRLASGEKVALRAVKDVKGGGHQGAITGAIVATSIVFFPAAPLFLLVHGKDITIPKGTEITAYINGDIPLDPKKFMTQTAVNPEAGATTVQSSTEATLAQNGNGLVAAFSTVEIKSTPAGAEITVDEKFMGSTPSSLRLTAGDHKIRLEKSGFRSWERTLTVGAGATTTVDPTLEKQE